MNYKTLVEQYAGLYLDYVNDFISVEGFAAYHNIPVQAAIRVINEGRVLHQDKFGHHQSKSRGGQAACQA